MVAKIAAHGSSREKVRVEKKVRILHIRDKVFVQIGSNVMKALLIVQRKE